jgi:hypothetical protein
MSFSCNPDTGAMTASMYHSVLKLLATFCTLSLPEQSTPYTIDLFDISEDLTPVDPKFAATPMIFFCNLYVQLATAQPDMTFTCKTCKFKLSLTKMSNCDITAHLLFCFTYYNEGVFKIGQMFKINREINK